jgi:hypothetical protein
LALSNIFREPRREITETVVGVIIPLLLGYGLYWYSSYSYDNGDIVCSDCGRASNIIIGMVLVGLMVFMFGLFISIAAHAIHALGEWLCDVLERRGIRLRPRR